MLLRILVNLTKNIAIAIVVGLMLQKIVEVGLLWLFDYEIPMFLSLMIYAAFIGLALSDYCMKFNKKLNKKQ